MTETRQDAPKLVQVCRSKHPRFGEEISLHIAALVRERHFRRAHAFACLQGLYLEAILKGLDSWA